MRSVKGPKRAYGCEIPNGKREDPGDEVVLFSCLLYFYFRFFMRPQYSSQH